MKRKVLLIISIVIILLLLTLAAFLVFKFEFGKDETLQAESIKDNDKSTEKNENIITPIKLNLYLFGESYRLDENIFVKNYVYEYSNNDIIVVIDNKYISPINYGNCILKILDNDKNVLSIYDITVYNEVVFDTSLTDVCYVNEEYYFKYSTNFSFQNLDIETTVETSLDEYFKVLNNKFDNDNKEISISFKFDKVTSINNNLEINTIINFDNYVLSLNKIINFNLYEKVDYFDVKYFSNEDEVSNNLYIIENEFYSDEAYTDGYYTYLCCVIYTNRFVNYNVKIENNSRDLITLLDINKNEINDMSNVKKFYIYGKETEGIASFTITDLNSNYCKTFEVNLSKIYADEYNFNIENNSEFEVTETREFYLESVNPSYAFKKDFTIIVDPEYISYNNNLMYFKKAGNTSIKILIDNKVIKSINITILKQTTYKCNLSSINLENVEINNLDRIITITNYSGNKNIVLNLFLLYNEQTVGFYNLEIITEKDYLDIETFDYPSFYVTLNSTGNTFLSFKFYDITVTYTIYIS